MRILFISNLVKEKELKKSDGVTNKMLAQINSFKNIGFEVSNIEVEKNVVYLNEAGNRFVLTNYSENFTKTWESMFANLLRFKNNYDYIYLRYDYIGREMLNYLKSRSKDNIKIILEIPTYMKKCEPGSSIKTVIGFYVRKLMCRKLKGIVDLIATFSDDDYIYGIPTVKIENAIDAENYKVLSFNKQNVKNEIHLIGVAMMTPSHGFDRVIKGLSEYYSHKSHDVKVYFHIVGSGSVKEKWQKLSVKLNVKDYVLFHGIQSGNELDNLFEMSDIAVGSLAIFRKKCKKCSEIKIREYCARGIPFIYSASEPVFEKGNINFCLKMEHNNSPIEINSVVGFCRDTNYKIQPSQMHDFALKEFNWDNQLNKIFDIFGGVYENIN